MRNLLIVGAVLLAPAVAFADGGGDVTITLSADGEQLAADLGLTVAELEQQAEETVARMYEINRVDDFLRAFADATSFSNRGIGVDYASNSTGLMFGVSGAVAAAGDDYGQEEDVDHPVAGVAPNLAVMGGINLSKWKHPQITFYGNAFYRTGKLDNLTGSIMSMGIHGQYKLFKPTKGTKSLVLKWGGLDLTAGLEFSRWSFGIGRDIETDYDVDGDNGTAQVHMVADGQFDLESDVIVVPFEATTSLRFLYFVSVYGGMGIDLQAGKSTIDADLTADMTATDPQGGDDIDMGTADIVVSGNHGPSVGKARFLAGVQVNIWKLKVWVQGNLLPVSAASVAFGLRVVL